VYERSLNITLKTKFWKVVAGGTLSGMSATAELLVNIIEHWT